MKISAFMVCEYATVDANGKAFLAGAGADTLNVERFPALVLFYLFWFIESERGDAHGDHVAKVTSKDGKIKGEIHFRTDELSARTKGTYLVSFQALGPMELTFQVSLDDEIEVREACMNVAQSR